MSGSLAALAERGVRFDVVSTAGAGAGLLYAAPRHGDPVQALQGTVRSGVADPLYSLLPVNFKVFQKPGRLADLYRAMLAQNPWYQALIAPYGNAGERLMSDWLQFLAASFSPSDLSSSSLGMCAPVPWIDDLIEFDRIAKLDYAFYVNAYNITDRRMENFAKHELTPKHFHAAMAFPFLYPPYEMNGKYYIEGAAIDALNDKSLVEKHPEVDTIVVFDILGEDKLIRKPRNLYDARVQSIIVPLVAVAKDDTKIFELKYNTGPDKRRLLKIKYDISDSQLPEVLDWSHGNLSSLYDIGYRAGVAFFEEHRDLLLAAPKRKPAPKRDVALAD